MLAQSGWGEIDDSAATHVFKWITSMLYTNGHRYCGIIESTGKPKINAVDMGALAMYIYLP